MSDFLDDFTKDFQLRFHRQPTPSEVANDFALRNHESRIQVLRTLDGRDLPMSREGAARRAMERAMHLCHRTLQKVGR
jgi:hypothetical protein